MTLVVTVGSVKHSPGASTLALLLALAWSSGDRVVVGADPDGCDFATRFGCGVEPGLVSLAMSTRHPNTSPPDVPAHSREITAGVRLVPGPVAGEEATSVLALAATGIAEIAANDPRVWITDAGRLTPRSPVLGIAARSMRTVLVVHGTAAALQPLPARVESLTRAGCRVGVVTVGRHGYRAAEVAEFAGCDVFGELPDEPNATGVAVDVAAGRRTRSRLWPAVTELAARLELDTSTSPDRVGVVR